MTPQDVFNTVATHLFKQGQRAVDGIGSCRYHTVDDLKCAVGCLIPDEMYSAAMEGQGAFRLVENAGRRGYSLPIAIAENKGLLASLQRVHDEDNSWQTTDTMRTALRHVAKANDLDASILDTLSFTDR